MQDNSGGSRIGPHVTENTRETAVALGKGTPLKPARKRPSLRVVSRKGIGRKDLPLYAEAESEFELVVRNDADGFRFGIRSFRRFLLPWRKAKGDAQGRARFWIECVICPLTVAVAAGLVIWLFTR